MNSKYPLIVLNNQLLDLEKKCFNNHIKKKKNGKFNQSKIWYKDNVDKLKLSTELINKSYQLLTQYGYNVDKNIFHIDFHTYNLLNNKYKNAFAWHQDDYGAINEKVNTIIYYLRKDEGIKSGNLLYKDKNNKKIEVVIKSNMILMLDGRIKHKPDNLEGYGLRNSIVVQFKRI
jgi:hypothetical protein